MKVIRGGVTAPKGFEANGLACGIKKAGRLDLALIYSQVPATAAGVFTTNRFVAHHITMDKANLKYEQAQAVLINSGNANCAVGKRGLTDAGRLTQALARNLSIEPRLVLMASTGIIGKGLPVEKIKGALGDLIRTKAKAKEGLAARAIMTTDKKPKEIAVALNIAGKTVKIGAMAKGAGMIAPNLATMLCFITTDACVEPEVLKMALKSAIDSSFNRISVDGDTSTNDTVIIMANSLAKNKKIRDLNSRDFFIFSKALNFVCQYLAKEIVLDGEGATKFIVIKVNGARTKADAEKIARRVANSSLFKTAMYGEDPNWGRVVAACGSSGVEIDPQKIEVSFGKISVFKNDSSINSDHNRLKNLLRKREIELNIDLNQGKAEGFIWTADLTEEYVKINSRYE